MKVIFAVKTHVFPRVLVLAALSCPLMLSAQTAEQIEELRQRSANLKSTNAPSLTPLEMASPTTALSSSVSRPSGPNYATEPRNGLVLPGEPTLKDVFPLVESQPNPPFAANLFIGGFESERVTSVNQVYKVAPGDKLGVWLWGAVNFTDTVTVDSQGNIFIPSVGPISVLDVPANAVNQTVSNRIKQVYTNDVEVYVNLLTATPVSVFVTGAVLRPGQYAGQPFDSVLYFLKRAGGIDFHRGSFRRIDVIHDSTVIQSIDLYDFVRNGQMPSLDMKDGSTILVHPLTNTVVVQDGARNSFTFEFGSDTLTGRDLIAFAKPEQFVSHAAISGLRGQKQFNSYVTITEFSDSIIYPGDHVMFVNNHDVSNFSVQVAGAYLGESQFIVSQGTRLGDVLPYISVEVARADVKNLFILRSSVARQQKELLDEALSRLERSVFTAPLSSTGEGSIRVQEAQLVTDYVERARKIKPLGRVVISDNFSAADVLLEPGDTIYIPEMTDLVQLAGEVILPQAVVYNPEASITDYLAWAGGMTDRADPKRVMIVRRNGSVTFTQWDATSDSLVRPGDQLIVMPAIDTKTMQSIKDITQILFQIALAGNVVR